MRWEHFLIQCTSEIVCILPISKVSGEEIAVGCCTQTKINKHGFRINTWSSVGREQHNTAYICVLRLYALESMQIMRADICNPLQLRLLTVSPEWEHKLVMHLTQIDLDTMLVFKDYWQQFIDIYPILQVCYNQVSADYISPLFKVWIASSCYMDVVVVHYLPNITILIYGYFWCFFWKNQNLLHLIT